MSNEWWILIGFFAVTWGVVYWRGRGGAEPSSFFRGTDAQGRELGFVMLLCTLLISWIFAKSVQNAADLGKSFGIVGGVAYAAYWLSFITAGIAIYGLRRAGFASLHAFLRGRFGRAAVLLFSLLLLFRLWNEIWSNTIVVAGFFGETGTASYYTAAWVTTGLVLGYSLVSGFRASVLTDAWQLILGAIVLVVILGYVFPHDGGGVARIAKSGSWTLVGGVDLLLVALLQIFSYPFHDPVMTDRGFVTKPRKMLFAFFTAGILGVVFITLFSSLGVLNHLLAMDPGTNSTVDTARLLGTVPLLAVNVMMLTSAASTIDSTFSSTGKLIAVDLAGTASQRPVFVARVAMIVLALLGGAMVHADPKILSATTVSGTMVIGLTPVFTLFWWKRAGATSYLTSVLAGIAVGIGYVFRADLPASLSTGAIGAGKYGPLLFWNVGGIAVCFALFVAFAWISPRREA